MRETIKPLASQLGTPKIGWHMLRHWNNTVMHEAGVDVKVRQQRLGHASAKVNLIYTHPKDSAQQAASEAIERRLQAAKAELEQATAEENPAVALNVATNVATQGEVSR